MSSGQGITCRAGFLYHKESADDREVLSRIFPEDHQKQWTAKDCVEMVAILSYQSLKEIEGERKNAIAEPETALPENYRDYEGFSLYDAQKCRID